MCTDFIYFPFFYKILTSDDFYIRHFNLGLKPKISTESQPNLQIGTKLLSCRRISKMRGGVKIMLGRLSLVLAPADVATVSSFKLWKTISLWKTTMQVLCITREGEEQRRL